MSTMVPWFPYSEWKILVTDLDGCTVCRANGEIVEDMSGHMWTH